MYKRISMEPENQVSPKLLLKVYNQMEEMETQTISYPTHGPGRVGAQPFCSSRAGTCRLMTEAEETGK